METKYESKATPTPPTVDGLVAQALQKFRKGMNSSLPLLRLREFYSQDKIKEVAELERKKVFDKFYPLVITFRGTQMGEMWTELDAGIEAVTEELLKANEHHKDEIHILIGNMMDFLCEEHELWLENQLSSNPNMESGERKVLLEEEKTRIINLFSDHCNKWNAEVVQDMASKLEEEVTRIQGVIEENHNHFVRALSSASTSDGDVSVPIPGEEKKKFVQMEEMILKTCEDFKDSWEKPSDESDDVEPEDWDYHGTHLDSYVKQVEKALKKNKFSNKKYQETHDRLKEVVAMAIKTLSLTANVDEDQSLTTTKSTGGKSSRKARKEIAADSVNGDDALMWERAFELDIKNCFPAQRASHQFKTDRQCFEFGLRKMIVKKIGEELIRESSEWKLGSFIPRRKLQDVVKSLELYFGVDYKSNRGPPKMFMERLYRVWKPRKSEVETEPDPKVNHGPSSGQGQGSE